MQRIAITVHTTQTVVDKLLVVFLDIANTCNLEKVITMIHKRAEAFQCTYNLCHVGNDWLLICIWNLSHEGISDWVVDRELYLLWIDKHNLQFVRVLLEKQRTYHSIKTYRLTLTGSTCYEKVWYLCKVNHEDLIRDCLTQSKRKIHLRLLELARVQN